jgi:hypothetical protein
MHKPSVLVLKNDPCMWTAICNSTIYLIGPMWLGALAELWKSLCFCPAYVFIKMKRQAAAICDTNTSANPSMVADG